MYFQDFSYREIGEILGINEDSTKMKGHRAKKKLCELNKSKIGERGVLNEM